MANRGLGFESRRHFFLDKKKNLGDGRLSVARIDGLLNQLAKMIIACLNSVSNTEIEEKIFLSIIVCVIVKPYFQLYKLCLINKSLPFD